MGTLYLWVKAMHIVFVASWFAGLFYLPRIFVNLTMVAPDSHAERERLLLMARKLYRFANLLMVVALALGLVLWLGYGVGLGRGNGWMHAKLALVLVVLGYQHMCRRQLRDFEQLANQRSEVVPRVQRDVVAAVHGHRGAGGGKTDVSSRHRSSATPLALALAALVLYASLYPFVGWRWPAGSGAAALLKLPWPPWQTALDEALNFMGYLPLGLLIFIAAARSGLRAGPAFALALLAPSALSYAMEVVQHLLPGRHPSLKDWLMNSLGALAGALLGAVCMR
jgi:putative membrane protein